MAIDLATGFNIGSKDAIDERQVLTLEQMKNLDESIYPDKYFAICKDNGKLYLYDVNNPVDAETGKFRKVGSNESVDPSIFQKSNDDSLMTEDKTIVGAINELENSKLDKPETEGTAGQILVLQDDGILAYADNVTEYDDTEIQEELDTKLDKEKVVQNLDAPDVESVLSTEALNTVLNNKLDRSDGSSLVPDTEIAKIHEHANQDVLDKLSDDGNGKLLYDTNPISVDEMTVIELNNFLDTLEIDAVGYVLSTTP